MNSKQADKYSVGEEIHFPEFIRRATGQKRLERALKDFKAYLVEDYIRERPDAPRSKMKKDAEQWAQAIIDRLQHERIGTLYANMVLEACPQFKKEDKSRKAKKSRSMRGKATKMQLDENILSHVEYAKSLKGKPLEKFLRSIEREHGREVAAAVLAELLWARKADGHET